MTGLITRIGNGIAYAAGEALWALGRREPSEDQLRDYFRRLELTTVYLNFYLDWAQVPVEVGRFPRLFRTHPHLINIAASGCLEVGKYPNSRLFLPHEKRELIAMNIADVLKRNYP